MWDSERSISHELKPETWLVSSLLLRRDNHDEDKPALNSIADNTVAMEVT